MACRVSVRDLVHARQIDANWMSLLAGIAAAGAAAVVLAPDFEPLAASLLTLVASGIAFGVGVRIGIGAFRRLMRHSN